MIPVLSRDEMRAFDEHAIETCKVPGLVLMENAARGVTDAILRQRPAGRVVVVCGGGNNGGDGLAIARQLRTRGAEVQVFLAAPAAKLTGDARTNLDAYRGVGGALVDLVDDVAPLRTAALSATVIVDALFGTGLDRATAGLAQAAIQVINDARAFKVAVDVPSGLDTNTGATLGSAVHADLTVTLGHYKLGLLTPSGAATSGRLELVDLGVPPGLEEPLGHSALLLEPSDVARTLSRRAVGAHKNSAGHVVVFAGSTGKVGAALMAAKAAFRAGAGMVTIATWPEAALAVEGRVPEVMTRSIARDAIVDSVDEILDGKRAVVMGPGFGTDEEARAVIEHILKTWEGPSVVDADALAVFEGSPQVFAAAKGATVLTPHPGEAGRLLGMSALDVEADRFAAIDALVGRARCVAVLKGAHTLVGAPEEKTVINASGTAALATAGAGDVLAGIIGALLCTTDPFEAAYAGVHLHGAAAEAWSATQGGADRGLLASEIADQVPHLIALLAAAHGRWVL